MTKNNQPVPTQVTWTKARQVKPNLVIASLLSRAGVWNKLITQVSKYHFIDSRYFKYKNIDSDYN